MSMPNILFSCHVETKADCGDSVKHSVQPPYMLKLRRIVTMTSNFYGNHLRDLLLSEKLQRHACWFSLKSDAWMKMDDYVAWTNQTAPALLTAV